MPKSSEFRVGMLILVVAILLGVMTMNVTEDPNYLGKSSRVWFYLKDASGIVEDSAVRMAGIKVGIVKKIQLMGSKAKLELVLDPDIKLKKTASVEVRPEGILGDKFVVLHNGEAGDDVLENGGQIANVMSTNSMEEMITKVGGMVQSLERAAKSIEVAFTDAGGESTPLSRIVKNIETMTEDMADVTDKNKDSFNNIVAKMDSITTSLDNFLNDDSEQGFRVALHKASEGLASVGESLSNVNEITEKINRGEGTIGRLVNEEETVEQLNRAVAGVNEFLGSANRLQTSLDVHSEYLNEQNSVKSYISLRLEPGLDRFYELTVVSDPKGVVETTETSVSSGGSTTTTEEVKTYKDKTKLSVQFGKNFYDFTVRAGLIENYGGFGMDYRVFRDKMKFSVEAFDFSRSQPYMRSYVRWDFMRGLYVIGGADDVLSTSGTFSSFLGAGIDLTNDDLKQLLSGVSF